MVGLQMGMDANAAETSTQSDGAIPTAQCKNTGPTASAPALTTGVWKNISPPQFMFGTVGDYSYLTQGFAVDTCNPSTIYVAVDGVQNSNRNALPAGLFRSTDLGSTWKKVDGPFQEPVQVRVDPKNSLHLYVGDGVNGSGFGFWVSHDGGATWAIPQSFLDIAKSMLMGDQDVYVVTPDPADFNHVLVTCHWYWDACSAGCNSGILESFNGGDSWTVHKPAAGWAGAGGYGAFFLYNPDLGIGDNKTWLYGTQGKGYWRTTDAGNTWTQVTTNNMEHGGSQLYYTKSGVLYAGGYPHPMRSMDNGASWTTIDSLTGGFLCITGDGTSLYTGTHSVTGPIFSSPETDGLKWSAVGAQQFDGGPYALLFDPTSNVLYGSFTDISTGNNAAGLWALKVK
jgi:hypothetical protein